MSNLLKQYYVINQDTEKRIINADDRYVAGGYDLSSDNYTMDGVEGAPDTEEILDGFLAGISAEEVQVEPEITPEELLQQAREDAEQILVTAKAEAAHITNEASNQAELLFEQKKQEGYNAGTAQIQTEFDEKSAQLQKDYDDMMQKLQTEYETKMETMESDIVDVMIRVFNKVFHVQFDNKKQILLHLIKDTMLGIDAGKEFVIRVSADSYKFIESHVADIKEKIGNDVTIDVVNDMTLEEGDCIIETATGVYNCGVEMVLANLEKDIKSLCR